MSNELDLPCIDCVVLGACINNLNTIQQDKDPLHQMESMLELMQKCNDFLEYTRGIREYYDKENKESSV